MWEWTITLVTCPLTMVKVVNAITRTLTVDSNLGNFDQRYLKITMASRGPGWPSSRRRLPLDGDFTSPMCYSKLHRGALLEG